MKKIFENGFVRIKKCKHGYFAYNKNDLFVGKSLELYGEWCEKEFEVLSLFIKKGDIILDIGAYIGTHSVFFGKKTGMSGMVFSFEPQRTAFQLLNTNLALNNLINVIAINQFVSDKKEIRKIPILDPFVKQNFGALKLSKFVLGETMNSITVDSLKLQECNLIKIDTEEGEERIIKGGKETINRTRPIIYIENNEISDSPKIIKTITSFGYKCYWHIFSYFNPNNFFNNKKDVFAKFQPEANMLCLPKESKLDTPKDLIQVQGTRDNWKLAISRKSK